MKKIMITIAAILCAAALTTGCGSSAEKKDSSSSQSTATAAPPVTLPEDSEENTENTESTDSTDNADSTDSADDTENAQITPMMWEVTSDEGTKITLMGSMHALKDEVYPLPECIQTAYDNADILAVECDVTSATSNFAFQLKEMENMFYEDGGTIEENLDPEIYEGVSGFIKSCGADPKAFETFRPWSLSSQLETLAIMQTDLDPQLGIDMNLLDMAHEDGKEIYEVESLEFQGDLLMDMPEDIYMEILSSYSAQTKDDIVQELEDTYDAWKTGDYDFFADGNDIDKLVEEARESGAEVTDEDIELMNEYNDMLLFDRNVGMADAVEELLEGDKDVFYVVGAAHFAGDGGIIDLLEQRGYEVTRIQNTQ